MANQDYRGGGLARRTTGVPTWSTGGRGRGMDPWREMAEMRRRMDDIFSGLMMPGFALPTGSWLAEQGEQTEPDVDIYENEGEYIIHALLPGVRPEDIHLEATNDTVRLTAEYHSPMEQPAGQTSQEAQTQPVTQHRQSRYSRQGSFYFSYSFPQEIRAETVRAELNNGRLDLHLPKVQPEASASRPRQIPVTTAGGQPSGSARMTGATATGQPQNGPGTEQVAGRAGRAVTLTQEGTTTTPQAGQAQSTPEKEKTPRKKAA